VKGWLAAAALLALSGCKCKQETKYLPVAVDGLPSCDQKQGLNMLHKPLVLELRDGDDFVRQVFTGVQPTDDELRLPDEERTWTLKVGECTNPTDPSSASYDCGEPNFMNPDEKVTLDPRKPGMRLAVKPIRISGCWR
jgi:hypothetical protein